MESWCPRTRYVKWCVLGGTIGPLIALSVLSTAPVAREAKSCQGQDGENASPPAQWTNMYNSAGCPPLCTSNSTVGTATDTMHCGHTLTISCETPQPCCFFFRITTFGADSKDIGKCIYPGGLNIWRYQWAGGATCFLKTKHRTRTRFRGSDGNYCWTITNYNVETGVLDPPICRCGPTLGWETDGRDCNAQGETPCACDG